MGAADLGRVGCWEYLDGKDVLRGPFSHVQMREWWGRNMFPKNLRIRAYDAAAASASKRGASDDSGFRKVEEAFADAPEPFAAGFSPRVAQEPEGEWHECGECKRQ